MASPLPHPATPLPPQPSDARLCEHEGRFNMLRPLLDHIRSRQGGRGVVAVSPRYAKR